MFFPFTDKPVESKLKADEPLYFGGSGNTKEYPLVHACSWTGKDVLRWLEIWRAEDHPGTVQMQEYNIKGTSGKT